MKRIFSRMTLLVLIFGVSLSVHAQKDVRSFMFGHSLMDHRPPVTPTPSDETTIPHWIALLAEHAGHTYAASGQYGFLPQHKNLPPFSQWGYDIVDAAWESDDEPFSDADFNNVLITAGNFVQYQAPVEEYYNDPDGTTPLSATLDIVDWLSVQEDSIKMLIYENWPDMGSIAPDFPPTIDEYAIYHQNTVNEFHDWWLEFHDLLISERPDMHIKMVPVGPIIAEYMVNKIFLQIDVEDLYEDNAPHGTSSLYFLAAVISYMSIYEEKAPSDFVIPDIIHPILKADYQNFVNFAWDYMQSFIDASGVNRVFSEQVVHTYENQNQYQLSVYPNPAKNVLHVEYQGGEAHLEILDIHGKVIIRKNINATVRLNMDSLPDGLYVVQLVDVENGEVVTDKFIKN